MAIPYNSTAFDTHKCTGGEILFPFRNQGDANTKVYVHFMSGNRSTYAPLADDNTMTAATQKPSGSPFSDDVSAYYVGDTEPQDQGDGTVVYERTFSHIPETRTDSAGVFPFDYPSTDTLSATVEYTSASGETASFSSIDGVPHGVVTGTWSASDVSDWAVGASTTRLVVQGGGNFEYYDGSSWTSLGTFLEVVPIVEINSNEITFHYDLRRSQADDATNFRVNGTLTNFKMQSWIPNRATFTRNTPSRLVVDYVKAASISAVSVENIFEVFDSSWAPVTELSTTTYPSKAQYLKFLQLHTYINAEPQQVRRWRGNIFERTSRQVLAL